MTFYILTEDDASVIGTGMSGNWKELDERDARVVAFKASMCWLQIKAERERRTEQGGFKVGAKWLHSDRKSRNQQLALALLGENIPAELQWKTMDGSFVAMTQALAQQILVAGAANDQAIFAAAEAHKAAMEASADPLSYDFSGGWPEAFEGA